MQFVSPEINWWITGPIALVVFVLLFRFTAARLFRSRANVRHRSLADTAAIEAGFGRDQARAAGKFTLPGHDPVAAAAVADAGVRRLRRPGDVGEGR